MDLQCYDRKLKRSTSLSALINFGNCTQKSPLIDHNHNRKVEIIYRYKSVISIGTINGVDSFDDKTLKRIKFNFRMQ